MGRRYVACWCEAWPEDQEPKYAYAVMDTLPSAKRIARAKANRSLFPDFAEVYEELFTKYGWDRKTTYSAMDSGWEKRTTDAT